ncbi:MAG: hypothetical protein ABL886_01980 [Rhodoglobus sp.]
MLEPEKSGFLFWDGSFGVGEILAIVAVVSGTGVAIRFRSWVKHAAQSTWASIMGFVRISSRVRTLEDARLPPLERDMQKLRDNNWVDTILVLPDRSAEPPQEPQLVDRIAALEKRLDDPRLKLPKLFPFEGIMWGPPINRAVSQRLVPYCPYCYERGVLTQIVLVRSTGSPDFYPPCTRSIHAPDVFKFHMGGARFDELCGGSGAGHELAKAVEARSKD